MGQYINEIKGKRIGTSFDEKSKGLTEAGARRTRATFKADLVCVVDNGFFAAAAYCPDEDEFEVFNAPDGRDKAWYVLEDAKSFVD